MAAVYLRPLDQATQEKVLRGDFADRYVVVNGVPKSGSQALTQALATVMPRPESRQFIRRQDPERSVFEPENILSAHLVEQKPEGGVVHVHFWASSVAFELIELLRAKCFVVCRHPLDNMVASCCHWRKLDRVIERSIEDGLPLRNVLARVDGRHLHPSVPIRESLDYLIQGGYLFHALAWMADWLAVAGKRPGWRVVRFEDLARGEAALADAVAFVLGRQALNAEMQAAVRAFSSYAEAADRDNRSVYPHGWTGRPGVWRDYCDQAHLQAYSRVVTAFVDAHPEGAALLTLYPDLINPLA